GGCFSSSTTRSPTMRGIGCPTAATPPRTARRQLDQRSPSSSTSAPSSTRAARSRSSRSPSTWSSSSTCTSFGHVQCRTVRLRFHVHEPARLSRPRQLQILLGPQFMLQHLLLPEHPWPGGKQGTQVGPSQIRPEQQLPLPVQGVPTPMQPLLELLV